MMAQIMLLLYAWATAASVAIATCLTQDHEDDGAAILVHNAEDLQLLIFADGTYLGAVDPKTTVAIPRSAIMATRTDIPKYVTLSALGGDPYFGLTACHLGCEIPSANEPASKVVLGSTLESGQWSSVVSPVEPDPSTSQYIKYFAPKSALGLTHLPIKAEVVQNFIFSVSPPASFVGLCAATSYNGMPHFITSTGIVCRRVEPDMLNNPRVQDSTRDVYGNRIKPFYMSITEVTRAQYLLGFAVPTTWVNDPDHPAVGMTWHDASMYAATMSRADGVEYRLPTTDEWLGVAFSNKIAPGPNEIVPKGRPRHARPTGEVTSDKIVFYDLFGNVSEWCSDPFLYPRDSNILVRRLSRGAVDDTPLMISNERSVMGPSFADLPSKEWALMLNKSLPEYRSGIVGFRLVFNAPMNAGAP